MEPLSRPKRKAPELLLGCGIKSKVATALSEARRMFRRPRVEREQM